MATLPFAEVAVGLPVPGTFHYRVPDALSDAVRVGVRVLVPFGRRGVTGVVLERSQSAPVEVDARSITRVLDELPVIEPAVVELCRFVARYYEAPPGEALRLATPSGTQVASRLVFRPTAAGRAALVGESTGALEARVRRGLSQVAGDEAARVPTELRAELVRRGFVEEVEEEERGRTRGRTVATVLLARAPTPEERTRLERAPRRLELVRALEAAGGPIDRTALPVAGAALAALVAQGVVLLGTREARRDPWRGSIGESSADALPPTPEQQAALESIAHAVDERGFRSFLLFGVTGSGKTEVYLQAIARVLARGQTAIVLVPEISLTPQLASRFRARFGDLVAVMHSGLSDGERFDEWRRLHRGDARIALGARSAVFAPVKDVGLIVVDEEHDSSFKQEEGVRYHARDVALVRAQQAGAVCVMGSATPSLESWTLASEGRHTLARMGARPGARPLPEVELVDLRTFRADPDALLTAPLAAAVAATLAAGEQTILFLNRRGFSTFVICTGCGHSFRCGNCSVSLTFHRGVDRLRCHYCGHSEPVPIACPGCGGQATIRRHGTGTEKVESAITARFPSARVARLDRDTAAGDGLRSVLDRVARREIDILVGTQMVTKGHDFPGVTLVGVLLADAGLALPDFRAGERTFQLLCQVAGRAGRGDVPGRVIVQTYDPSHPALACAQHHDYEAFQAAETAVRAELGYPPHGRLIAVRLEGPDDVEVRAVADDLAERARRQLGSAAGVVVLGPAEAPLARLKGKTRWHLWLKSSDRVALRAFARRLLAGLDTGSAKVRVVLDVDPLSAL